MDDRGDQLDEWTRWLSEPFRDRRVIVGPAILAGATASVADLRRWGAHIPLVISTGDGTGPLPGPHEAHVVRVPLPVPEDMTGGIRAALQLAAAPPPVVADAVEAFDPDGEALWWAGHFDIAAPLLGRAVFGGRRASWSALEDKTLCDAIWDEAGVRRSPTTVVSVADAASAASGLDAGAGTVWSGDARDGLNGGGDFVRWVSTASQSRAAVAFFGPRCDRVRVMPYVDGTACSIHGFVLPDGTAAFRPVELVSRPDRATGRFGFAGMSTWWDPPSPVREHMRAAAVRVGAVLRSSVDYRGGFSIDGVVGPKGFWPTELNPRFSGGLATMARAVPGVPLGLVQDNAVLGRDVRITAAELDVLVTSAADRTRLGNVMAIRAGPVPTTTRELPVRLRGGRIEPTRSHRAEATLSVGPHAFGTFYRMFLDSRAMRTGASAVPQAAALHAFADSETGRSATVDSRARHQ